MSVLAYSELLRRIAGVDEKSLQRPYEILSKHNTTKKRLQALKALAEHGPCTIGKLLQAMHHNRGGGSYLTLQTYFNNLAHDGLMVKQPKNNRLEWSFSKDYQHFQSFLLGN